MKTTSRVLVVAVTASVWSALQGACHAEFGAGMAAWTAVAAVGQAGSRTSDPRRECLALVARARQAMDEADWETADKLLSQADGLKVQFNKFIPGDSPAKARRDLEKARPAAGKSTVQRKGASRPQDPFVGHSDIPPAAQMPPARIEEPAPSAQASADVDQAPADRLPPVARTAVPAPAGNAYGAPPIANPYVANNRQAPAPAAAVDNSRMRRAPQLPMPEESAVPMVPPRNVAQMPPNGGPTANLPPRAAAAQEQTPVFEATSDPAPLPAQRVNAAASAAPATSAPGTAQRDQLLLSARKALAVGDTAEASRMTAEVKAQGGRYGLHDDTPSKVEAAIAKFVELNQQKSGKDSESYRRRQAELLMEQADALLAWKDFDTAERLATSAKQISVNYGVFDAKPDDVLNRIAAGRRKAGRFRDSAVQPAELTSPVAATPSGAATEAAGQAAPAATGTRAVYAPGSDTTRNVPASGAGDPFEFEQRPNPPSDLFVVPEQGQPAARQASGESRIAIVPSDEAPSPLPSPGASRVPSGDTPSADLPQTPGTSDAAPGALLNKTLADQQLLARKVIAELANQQSQAKQLQPKDPKQALEVLQRARVAVEKSQIDPTRREQLLRSVDRNIADLEQYIEKNRPRIELNERNQAVKNEIKRDQDVKVEVQEKLAYLVDQFNTLMDEQRYAEAEAVAKKAQELAPEEPIVVQLTRQALFARRNFNAHDIASRKEDGFVRQMEAVDLAGIPETDYEPYRFGDATRWAELTKTRAQQKRDGRARRSEKEIEIEQRLKTPVSLKFQDAPLSEVMDHLAKLALVNLHLDPRGLAAEGVTSETPVTINLSAPITLKSALNLILEPLHLSYVIKNEVLSVTSEDLRDGEIFTVTYSVADLIVPIPNFVPSGDIGLTGALNQAQANARAGMVGFGNSAPLGVMASASGAPSSTVVDPRLMAQMAGGPGSNPGMGGMPSSMNAGPGGLTGASQPDFDSLMELISSTVQPDSWDENGGPGAMQRFPNNLSLVISQRQDVHDEIADLLRQLRRLHDLQVTIEVRFITLNDNFFERIGVDFDFNLEDFAPGSIVGAANVGTLNQGTVLTSQDNQFTPGNNITVGLSAPGVFNADLDVPFKQDSFSASIPQFGFTPNTGASLGFAILSDIEAFFFIEAAQGDRRSNVLQAPKVTLFNGQQAFISDTSQSPFVISVIPVVGDFAAAQQPVIVVLSEGTFLTVQAVVSEDRRFVRLTLVPFFSNIGQVNTFTFTGASSTTEASSSTGQKDDTTGRAATTTRSAEGTTVQLPTFSFVTVSTTVSVPDGGTVLLGGIKRLSEGRNEFGIPLLSKVPYVNRLFRNVGIGRTTQSLMMMVTPRIIIQEEEEFNLTGQQPIIP